MRRRRRHLTSSLPSRSRCVNSLLAAAAQSARPRVMVEGLESRTLLATFTALLVPDGATNSLRYYIDKANTNAQNDTINLRHGRYELSITNTAGQENHNKQGDLDVTESGRTLTLKGAGVKKTFIDANEIDRVFHIFDGVTVIFKDLTITGGLAVDDGGEGTAPADSPAFGGGILSDGGNLQFYNVAVSYNTASSGGTGFDALGGGLFIRGGTQKLDSLTVDHNKANASPGTPGTGFTFDGSRGGSAFGGGLFVSLHSPLTISSIKVTDNCAVAGDGGAGTPGEGGNGGDGGTAQGGGIFSVNALTLNKSDVSRNKALAGDGGAGGAGLTPGVGGDGGTAQGGGIYAHNSVTISATSVTCNLAQGGDGGPGAFGDSLGIMP